MDDFDHGALYYRVLGDGAGYVYRAGEPEALASGAPPARDRPFYEFDDLESIGRWLFLGDRVLVLRVPADALVEANTPMSQGGCMACSASRVEVVGELSFAELMRRYDAEGVRPRSIHLARQDFEARPLTLPAGRLGSLNLDHCRGRIDLSPVRERVTLWQSPVDVLAWPKRLAELAVGGGRLRGRLAAARSLSLDDVALDDVEIPAGCRCVSLFGCRGRVDLTAARGELSLTKCALDIAGMPDAIERLYASDCRFRGIRSLPAGEVRGCTFA